MAGMTMLLAAAAQAAVLSDAQGVVQVNRGDGFQGAGNGTGVGPGDRVRTGDGATSILYDNGCSVKVDPHQVVTVLSPPPDCVVGALPGLSTETVVVGGLVIGGGIALIVSSSPSSP
jgi:hypothetical protein